VGIKNLTVYLDNSAPSPVGSGITINTGALLTKNSLVDIALAANDDTIVSQMCISTSSGSCSSWEAHATHVTRTLSAGDGIKTYYVWFKDGVGNTSGPFDTSITYDTTPPVSSISPLGGTYALPQNLTFSSEL